MILFLFYLIGCYISFKLISTNAEKVDIEQPIIVTATIFSWVTIIILIITKLCYKLCDKK